MTTQVSRRSVLSGVAALSALGAISTVNSASAFAASSTMQYGSSGSAVKTMQNRLNSSGYYLGSADGHFGAMTQQAVYAVQKVHGLARDGVVGPRTNAAINSGQRPGVRSRANGIEIDRTRGLVVVVRNGRAEVTLNASTAGNYSFYFRGRRIRAVTPTGNFHVQSHVNSWQTGVLGSMYRPYYFNGDIAIHGDAASDVPPNNVSHGCCRVSTGAQDMLIGRGYLSSNTNIRVY